MHTLFLSLNTFEYVTGTVMDEWVFARVKGIPSSMRWPVQILEEKPEGLVEVFCKADDAVVPSEEEGYLKVLQV